MITRMGVGFQATIIEDDNRLATLSNSLCPDATVVHASSTAFLRMLSASPTLRIPPQLTLSSRVNMGIYRLPLSRAAFPIHGIDVTIFCHLSIPLMQSFPSELAVVLRIIRHLSDQRKLSSFIII